MLMLLLSMSIVDTFGAVECNCNELIVCLVSIVGTNLINKQLAESHPIVNACCICVLCLFKPFVESTKATAAAAADQCAIAFIAPYEIIILKVKVTALN